MSNRIPQLDFLKGILMINVIMIHLIYLGQCHPDFKLFLLLFTTPAFFIISGYLAHANKPAKVFFKKVFWWLVPYVIMEGAYIVMASFLPIKEHIDHLTLGTFLHHLLLSPLGPYWYIHDLIIGYVGYYIIYKVAGKDRKKLQFVVALSAIVLLSCVFKFISIQSCLFFCIGVIIKQTERNFILFFRPSWIALVLFLCLSYFHTYIAISNLSKGIVLSFLFISSILVLYPHLPTRFTNCIHMIGRNTLAILLFSPMFTIITKQFVPFLSFEPTAVLFTVVSIVFTIMGCFAVTYLMDICKISPYFCGEERFWHSLTRT